VSYWFGWWQLTAPTTTGWQESVLTDNTFRVTASRAGSTTLAVRGQHLTLRDNRWESTLPNGSVTLNMAGASISDTVAPAFTVLT